MGLFKTKEQKLKVAEWELKDAIYYFEKWSFGNTPSQDRDALLKISKRARKVASLGGDPNEFVPSYISRQIDEI